MKFLKHMLVLPAVLGLAACSNTQQPMKTVDHVDIDRFMGDWYVIASIPTYIEKNAFNAVESYELDEKGNIQTTFTFREGGFDGKQKKYRPTGYVVEKKSNAIWGMQFVWPIKADYRIVYLDEGYSQTIIARQKRDYVWIMARSPEISQADYSMLTGLVGRLGYDTGLLRKVPHNWSRERDGKTEANQS